MTFIPGQSGNPTGRPKLRVVGAGSERMRHSSRTVKGALERFIKRNYTARKLQQLFDAMSEKQRLELYQTALPYLMPRPQADAITPEEAEQLYTKQVQLEQRNKQLEKQLKELTSVGQERIS